MGVIQSVLYTAALVSVYLFQIINVLDMAFFIGKSAILTVRKLNLVFQPLQGFFNLCIFVWSKVASRRLYRPEISVGRVICDLFPACYCFTNQGDTSHSEEQNEENIITFDPDAWGSFE